jgi:hypothetical protein
MEIATFINTLGIRASAAWGFWGTLWTGALAIGSVWELHRFAQCRANTAHSVLADAFKWKLTKLVSTASSNAPACDYEQLYGAVFFTFAAAVNGYASYLCYRRCLHLYRQRHIHAVR